MKTKCSPSSKIPQNNLKELQSQWYDILKETGFEEIENTDLKEPELITMHSFHFCKDQVLKRMFRREDYQLQIEDFLHHPSFLTACEILTRHGNSAVSNEQVTFIWTMHIGGLTEREIAEELDRSKTCVHRILSSLQEWMRFI